MNEKICIVIPIKTSNLEEIKDIIYNALEYNPQFIELRFDYIPKVEDLTDTFIEQIKSLLQKNAYSIFTFRHQSEGGQIGIDESSRLKILEKLIEHKPDFFDLEMKSKNDLLISIINLCYMNKVNLILSYHNFESTPSLEQAKEVLYRFEEKVVDSKLDEFDILDKCIYKLIFNAQKIEDNLIPLTLCKDLSKSYKKIISFCMGDTGLISRLFCIKLGSFMTYASLKEQTVNGQVNIETFQRIYKLLFS